ncbi:MAG: hypothetical protein ACREQ7_14645 [Candidatus Binatia bacterium]
MSPQARALAQALLDHHKRLRAALGENPAVDSCVLAYGDLCERAGVPQIKHRVGKFLREIADWCDENGWPPLNSLAVNHNTRKPGHGYDTAPGCNLEHWPEQMVACIYFSDYPDRVN